MSNDFELISKFLIELDEFNLGNRSFCIINTGVVESELPSTPFRGLKKMHEIEIPKMELQIDNYIWAVGKYLGGSSFNLQYNIDSFDSSYKSPPLNFHFDRGARYTILGALRGAENKYNVLLPINSICQELANQSLLSKLKQSVFYDRKLPGETFAILHEAKNTFQLNDEIIKRQLEFSDILSDESEGNLSLCSFLDKIEFYNQRFLTSNTQVEEDKANTTFTILLNDGDLLILNNSQVLHGRRSGDVINVIKNRWLRTMFVS